MKHKIKSLSLFRKACKAEEGRDIVTFEAIGCIILVRELGNKRGEGMKKKGNACFLKNLFSPANILIFICLVFLLWAIIDAALNGDLLEITGPKGIVGLLVGCALLGQILVFFLRKLFLYFRSKSSETKKLSGNRGK